MEENINTNTNPTPDSNPTSNPEVNHKDKKSKIKLNKTMLLVAGLVLLTGILLFASIKSKSNLNPFTSTDKTTVEADFAHSSLAVSEQPRVNSTTGINELDVNINANENKVTGSQIEISYDPKILTEMDIKPGTFFDNPVVVYKKIDNEAGRITFMVGGQIGKSGKQGKGSVAVLSFKKVTPDSTTIDLLPESLVTAEGQDSSVLNETTSAQIGEEPAQTKSISPTAQ